MTFRRRYRVEVRSRRKSGHLADLHAMTESDTSRNCCWPRIPAVYRPKADPDKPVPWHFHVPQFMREQSRTVMDA